MFYRSCVSVSSLSNVKFEILTESATIFILAYYAIGVIWSMGHLWLQNYQCQRIQYKSLKHSNIPIRWIILQMRIAKWSVHGTIAIKVITIIRHTIRVKLYTSRINPLSTFTWFTPTTMIYLSLPKWITKLLDSTNL